ncbi:hypothetical protein [Tenacibaculum agarivorans]|nr:hypothetical protein [Tenacibaculum agarivorans]
MNNHKEFNMEILEARLEMVSWLQAQCNIGIGDACAALRVEK